MGPPLNSAPSEEYAGLLQAVTAEVEVSATSAVSAHVSCRRQSHTERSVQNVVPSCLLSEKLRINLLAPELFFF